MWKHQNAVVSAKALTKSQAAVVRCTRCVVFEGLDLLHPKNWCLTEAKQFTQKDNLLCLMSYHESLLVHYIHNSKPITLVGRGWETVDWHVRRLMCAWSDQYPPPRPPPPYPPPP